MLATHIDQNEYFAWKDSTLDRKLALTGLYLASIGPNWPKFYASDIKTCFLCFQEAKNIDPNESFAWKDSTLDRKLKELEERAKQQSALSKCSSHVLTNPEFSICNWLFAKRKCLLIRITTFILFVTSNHQSTNLGNFYETFIYFLNLNQLTFSKSWRCQKMNFTPSI